MPPENSDAPDKGASLKVPALDSLADGKILTPPTGDINLEVFLRCLHGHVPPVFIEVRLIEDCKQGAVVEQVWYPSIGDVVADLPRLCQIASKRGAGIFFGVLPRKVRGKGKSVDTLPGLVAWADLDFKDYAGGETEARRRLAEFPVRPSIIVRSGHGLHAYWLVTGPTAPAVLSALSRRLALALGADHAFDAARILRLPGTLNVKDSANPIRVEIELLEPSRRYEVSEISAALDSAGIPAGESNDGKDSPDIGPIEIAGKLSDGVLGLLDRHPILLGYFEGRGKSPVGEDGKSLDTSSSGYDISLAMSLIKRGVTDPSEIGTAIWHRPDGAAQAKGIEYVARTVRRALERVAASESKAKSSECNGPDFTIEKVRIFKSDPAIYEFTVDGFTFRLSSAELKAKGKFAVRFMDALRRVPLLPGKADAWRRMVNGWLQKAEIVEMPPEASEEPALREAIQEAIESLRAGDNLADLERGKSFKLEDGRTAFKTKAILDALKADLPDLKANAICRVLRDLGYQSETPRVGEKAIRVWVKP